ncbi:hypothetical protein HMI54_004999 [Coelomomyces lativittatus]|nr:hypothetical protein HMI55_002183 [Coelomomyces lativittatus]KAJ1517623.1 hypothetical protein HMI54_004999 [Coelomomyces lativittatus]
MKRKTKTPTPTKGTEILSKVTSNLSSSFQSPSPSSSTSTSRDLTCPQSPPPAPPLLTHVQNQSSPSSPLSAARTSSSSSSSSSSSLFIPTSSWSSTTLAPVEIHSPSLSTSPSLPFHGRGQQDEGFTTDEETSSPHPGSDELLAASFTSPKALPGHHLTSSPSYLKTPTTSSSPSKKTTPLSNPGAATTSSTSFSSPTSTPLFSTSTSSLPLSSTHVLLPSTSFARRPSSTSLDDLSIPTHHPPPPPPPPLRSLTFPPTPALNPRPLSFSFSNRFQAAGSLLDPVPEPGPCPSYPPPPVAPPGHATTVSTLTTTSSIEPKEWERTLSVSFPFPLSTTPRMDSEGGRGSRWGRRRPLQFLDLPEMLQLRILKAVIPCPSPHHPYFSLRMPAYQRQLYTLIQVHSSWSRGLLPKLYECPMIQRVHQLQTLVSLTFSSTRSTSKGNPGHPRSFLSPSITWIQGGHFGHVHEHERGNPMWSMLLSMFLERVSSNFVYLHLGFMKRLQLTSLPPSLRHVYLVGTQWSPQTYVSLLTPLIPHLHTLSLAWNVTVTDDVLCTLIFGSTPLTSSSSSSSSSGSSSGWSFPSWHTLDITYCPHVTNVGLRAIAQCAQLRRLGVSFCPLFTMEAFCQVLHQCRHLHTCHLVTPHRALISYQWQRLVRFEGHERWLLPITRFISSSSSSSSSSTPTPTPSFSPQHTPRPRSSSHRSGSGGGQGHVGGPERRRRSSTVSLFSKKEIHPEGLWAHPLPTPRLLPSSPTVFRVPSLLFSDDLIQGGVNG